MPFLASFQAYFGRIFSSTKPTRGPDASCLCAREKGRGLSIKGEPCKCVFSRTAGTGPLNSALYKPSITPGTNGEGTP